MNKKVKILFFSLILSFFALSGNFVFAQYGIDTTAKETPIKNFMNTSLQTMTGNIIGTVLAMVGIIFFTLMIYGGIVWMTATGNQEKEKKAIGIIVSAAVGIVLVLSAYVLVRFVFDIAG